MWGATCPQVMLSGKEQSFTYRTPGKQHINKQRADRELSSSDRVPTAKLPVQVALVSGTRMSKVNIAHIVFSLSFQLITRFYMFILNQIYDFSKNEDSIKKHKIY